MTNKQKALEFANKYWHETKDYRNSYIVLNKVKKLNDRPQQKQN